MCYTYGPLFGLILLTGLGGVLGIQIQRRLAFAPPPSSARRPARSAKPIFADSCRESLAISAA